MPCRGSVRFFAQQVCYANKWRTFGACIKPMAYSIINTDHMQVSRPNVSSKGFEKFNSHSVLGLLIVAVAKECSKQQGPPMSTSRKKDLKKLGLFRSKVYSLASLQMCMDNYRALFSKDTFTLQQEVCIPGCTDRRASCALKIVCQ